MHARENSIEEGKKSFLGLGPFEHDLIYSIMLSLDDLLLSSSSRATCQQPHVCEQLKLSFELSTGRLTAWASGQQAGVECSTCLSG